MESLNQIESKLEKFIKRYYLSAVIRGVLLFFGFGVLYILFWVIVESFFWLPSIARGLIFWCIIGFEAVLFYNLIVVPALRYLKIRKPIDSEKAAALIGESFPEIKDKLLNVIQLGQQQKTELVLASINKRARFPLQARIKNSLTRCIKIITIDQRKHDLKVPYF